MLKICLVFWESEPQYAYKRYAYKKTCTCILLHQSLPLEPTFEEMDCKKMVK